MVPIIWLILKTFELKTRWLSTSDRQSTSDTRHGIVTPSIQEGDGLLTANEGYVGIQFLEHTGSAHNPTEETPDGTETRAIEESVGSLTNTNESFGVRSTEDAGIVHSPSDESSDTLSSISDDLTDDLAFLLNIQQSLGSPSRQSHHGHQERTHSPEDYRHASEQPLAPQKEAKAEAHQTKGHQGIKRRFCLLVNGEGKNKTETKVFEEDCQRMGKILTRNLSKDVRSQNVYLATPSELEAQFLRVVFKREQQIMESLQLYLSLKNPHWREISSVELLECCTCVYTRVRVLKSWFEWRNGCSKKVKCLGKEESRLYLEVLNCVWKRWHRANDELDLSNRCIWLHCHKALAPTQDANSFDNNFRKDYHLDIEQCGIKNYFYSKDGMYEVHSLADCVFAKSLHCSGFPTTAEEKCDILKYAEFFHKPLDRIHSLEDETNDKSNERTAQKLDKLSKVANDQRDMRAIEAIRDQRRRATLKTIMDCFAEWSEKKDVPDQWIWMHYSGHGSRSSEWIKMCTNLCELMCELFTDVVISMDCCFPKIKQDVSYDNCCILLPNKSKFETHYDDKKNESDFTKLLAFALEGFPSQQCYSVMKDIYGDRGKCYCEPCRLHFEMEKMPHTLKVGDQGPECERCKELQQTCSTNQFIYPNDILRFFDAHICKGEKVRPQICLGPLELPENMNLKQRPLVHARDDELSD